MAEGMTPEEIEGWSSFMTYQLAQRYRAMSRVIKSPLAFHNEMCTKENIFRWLLRPWDNESRLRSVSRYMYDANGQYRRICDHQPNLLNFAYVVSPISRYPDDEASQSKYKDAYFNAASMLDSMNIKTELRKPVRTCMVEGVAFGYAKQQGDAFRIMMLDSDYCRITSIDGTGCIRFDFNYEYFDRVEGWGYKREAVLKSFGKEFEDGYALYKADRECWRPVGEDGICLKFHENNLEYSLPPYVAVLPALFDIEDYKRLAKAREEAGNYNLLGFEIPTNKDGKILMDLELAKRFIEQASSELPETIGVLLSPMQMEKFNFAKENATADANAVADAEEQFWLSTGMSELLFGSSKSSANALNKSIISDEIDIMPVLRQIERWINRRMRTMRGKYKFKAKFLNVTAFNESDKFDQYLKAANAGMPTKNMMAAALGYTPYEVMMMGELENTVVEMRDKVYCQPLFSSSTMTSESVSETGGRPQSDEADLSEAGEATRNNEGNIRE